MEAAPAAALQGGDVGIDQPIPMVSILRLRRSRCASVMNLFKLNGMGLDV